MPSICIVTGAHLCRNPRVVKEATALAEAGYEVTVLGPAFEDDLLDQDRAITRDTSWHHRIIVDLRPGSGSARKRLVFRLRRRLAIELTSRGMERPGALGYGLRQTLRAARTLGADLTIGHQEVGLWVVHELMREGYRVGADLEDWYSRDLLPEAQAKRPLALLKACEGALVRHGAHVTTTSEALAEALATAYGGPRPTVLYNAFPWRDRKTVGAASHDRTDASRPSLHWVSQTIGPGRGLDTLCAALAQVQTPVDVHLRGRGTSDDEAWLRDLFPTGAGHRLYVHDLVPPAELLARIAEHDVGIAVEETDPPSRNLTVTNKILHYLLGGLAVVATDTAGQREVYAQAGGAVELCRSGNAASMAEAIERLVGTPERLAAAKSAALETARAVFSWEVQVPMLLASVSAALHTAGASRHHMPEAELVGEVQ